MTEKHNYAAKIRTKGCDNTGITQDIAKSMFNTLGRTTYGIVSLEHRRQVNDDEQGRSVELVITMIEPSQDPALDEHLQQLARTMHQNRVLNSDEQQLQIDVQGDLEPTVEEVIAAKKAAEAIDPDEPHQFVDVDGECEICEAPEGNPLHELVDAPEPVPA